MFVKQLSVVCLLLSERRLYVKDVLICFVSLQWKMFKPTFLCVLIFVPCVVSALLKNVTRSKNTVKTQSKKFRHLSGGGERRQKEKRMKKNSVKSLHLPCFSINLSSNSVSRFYWPLMGRRWKSNRLTEVVQWTWRLRGFSSRERTHRKI